MNMANYFDPLSDNVGNGLQRSMWLSLNGFRVLQVLVFGSLFLGLFTTHTLFSASTNLCLLKDCIF